MLELLAFVFAFLILYRLYLSTRHPKGFPPGPRWSLPLVGDAHLLGENLVEGIEALRAKYGDIMGLNLGPLPAVVISDLAAIHEVLGREEFLDRPEFLKPFRVRLAQDGTIPGVGFTNGDNWKEQRKFTMTKLKDFGFGRRRMEEIIEEQVDVLTNKLAQDGSEPREIFLVFNIAVINALWMILTNEQLSLDHPKAYAIQAVLSKFDEVNGSPLGFLAFSSGAAAKLMDVIGLVDFTGTFKNLHDISAGTVKEHRATFDASGELRDFIDAYLAHSSGSDASKDLATSFKGDAGAINLEGIVQDLFAAGSATISLTICWAMLFLANRPELQATLRAELRAARGKQTPRYADRTRTPLLEAILHETQRRANIVPFSLPRLSRVDTQFRGYFIPKGTQILPNLGAVMNDPEVFPEPHKFDPYRHIDAEGNFVASQNVIPFSVGRRRCLGETLARAELYQYVAGVICAFEVKREGEELIREVSMPQALSKPYPFKLRFVKLTSN